MAGYIDPDSSFRQIPGDPLTFDQKKRIEKYVEGYLLTDTEIETQDAYGRAIRIGRPVIAFRYFDCFSALAKTYDSLPLEVLEQSQRECAADT